MSATGMTAPDLMWIVASSRRADERFGGSVPYQPWVGDAGSVRCNFLKTEADGTSGGDPDESLDDLGRNEAKIAREFCIA